MARRIPGPALPDELDEAEEEEAMILLYRGPDGEFKKQPPEGDLDGWAAKRVPLDLWEEYEDARRLANDLAHQLEKAVDQREGHRHNLLKWWGAI